MNCRDCLSGDDACEIHEIAGFSNEPGSGFNPNCYYCSRGEGCVRHNKLVADPVDVIVCRECGKRIEECSCCPICHHTPCQCNKDNSPYACPHCGDSYCHGECLGMGGIVGNGKREPKPNTNKNKSNDLPEDKPNRAEVDCSHKDVWEHKDATNAMSLNLFGLQSFSGTENNFYVEGFADFEAAAIADPNNEYAIAMNRLSNNVYTPVQEGLVKGKEDSITKTHITVIPRDYETVADVHSHPIDGPAPPSPLDVWGTMKNIADGISNFQGRYVRAPNGDYYCVAVADKEAARNFIRNHSENDVLDGSMFKKYSKFEKAFKAAMAQYGDLGPDNAWCHALSYISEKYGMGITIMKAEKGGKFVSKHVIERNGVYLPAECN